MRLQLQEGRTMLCPGCRWGDFCAAGQRPKDPNLAGVGRAQPISLGASQVRQTWWTSPVWWALRRTVSLKQKHTLGAA